MNNFFTEIKIEAGLNKAKITKGIFKYIRRFSILSFKHAAKVDLETRDCETGLVILKGNCDIAIDGKTYKNLGQRDDVFHGLPTGIYVPIQKKYTISGINAEIAICSSKCEKESDFAIISPEAVKVMEVGKDNWKRQVRMIIGPASPSINLLVGETLNPPGNWSGTPAHKHERVDYPRESLHEELYYFKTDQPKGFGIERLYSYERKVNELLYLKENTITFMPWGYHQIVAGPGYWLYYLFFLSGEGKQLNGLADPAHKWLNE
jgi:5-deoxy-glucuronate isomerase